jgi:hypothetical protein
MQRRPFLRLLLVFLTIALRGYAQDDVQTVPAQVSKPELQGQVLTGTVVNSLTGQGINRAVVEMFGSVNGATMTDPNGEFEFDSAKEGSVTLVAVRPGFLDERAMSNRQFVVQVGPGTTPVVLRMTPANSIVGRVTAEDGEPIEGIVVRAIAEQNLGGRRTWVDHVYQAHTFEDGNYRITNVPPGTYYVAVEQSKETTLREPGIPNGREQEYAQVFYPGVSDFAAAAAIDLHGGQEVEEDFALTSEPVYKVLGTVLAQDQVSSQVVFARIAGTGYDFTENAAVQDGKFQTELPAGSYLVRAFAPGGLLLSNASAPVDVSSDASNLRITLTPSPSIPVTVREESDSGTTVQVEAPQAHKLVGVSLHLLSNVLSNVPFPRNTDIWWDPRSNEMQNVEPGVYQFEPNTFGQWRVESAYCGNVDLMSQNLTISAGSEPSAIEITLRNDGGTVSGTVVESNGQLATVLLVQEHGDRNFVKSLTRVYGTFQFNGLAPGDYALLASDGIDRLAYTNPEVLNPLLSSATHVNLQPHGSVNVSLSLSSVQ